MSDTVPEEPIPSDPAPEEGNDTVGVVPTGGDVSEGEPPPPPADTTPPEETPPPQYPPGLDEGL